MLPTITYLPFWKTIKSYIIHNRRLTLEPIIIQLRSFFTELSTYLKLSEPEPFQKLPENIDSAGNAKLRYVSGY
jgi:hypothetical protein